MKKFLFLAFLISLLTLTTVACDSTNNQANNNQTNNNQANNIEDTENNTDKKNEGIVTNKIKYEVIDNNLSDELKTSIDQVKVNRGYGIIKETEDSFVIYVGSGKKNTGGYNIDVVSVEDIEGTTKIIVEETAPQEGEMVTEAITYPMTVIMVDKNISLDNIKVMNTKEEYFEKINYDAKEVLK